MFFILPPLPYDYKALEPYMDARTVEIHYDKHHRGYVDGLNKALADKPELKDFALEDLLKKIPTFTEPLKGDIRFFGGGTYNHTFFWESMKPSSTSQPSSSLLDVINSTYGSLQSFKDTFIKKATGVRGSGWCWLLIDKQGALSLVTTSNHDCPLTEGFIPLLVVDVWEHAYYLKYQNKRADFLEAWWHLIDWNIINQRYNAALQNNKLA